MRVSGVYRGSAADKAHLGHLGGSRCDGFLKSNSAPGQSAQLQCQCIAFAFSFLRGIYLGALKSTPNFCDSV